MTPTVLAALALIAVLAPATVFFQDALRSKVREGQLGFRLGSALAVVLGTGSVVMTALVGGPWGATLALSVPAILLGAAFAFILHRRHVPDTGKRIREGEAMRPFTAMTDTGETITSADLAGQRVLLKFFRGHWCPFCSVELKQLDALRPELERKGIRVIALSKDTPEQAAKHRERDNLKLTLASDPELRVIGAYGLEHRKALEISGAQLTLAGLPIGTRPKFATMAAPANILIDVDGTVRWVDVAEDYKIRSDCQRLLQAIERAFPDIQFDRRPAQARVTTGRELGEKRYVACGEPA